MNFRTTLGLAVLVVVGGAVWLFSREKPQSAEDVENSGAATPLRYVLDPRPQTADVVRLTVERPDQPRLVFERGEEPDPVTKSAPWRMIEPTASETESYMVDGLIGTFVGLQYRQRYAPDSRDAPGAAAAGLEPPQAAYTLVDKSGKEYRVEIGRKAALSNDTYVRGPGGVVYLCQRDFSYDLKKTVNDYRAKSLFKLSRKDAVKVRVEHAGRTYELTRSGEDWIMDSPARAYADSQKVQALVNAVGAVRVAEFLEDAPQSLEPFGLAPPVLTVSVTTQETRELPATQPATDTQPAEPQTQTVTRSVSMAFGTFADMQEKQRYLKLTDQPWVASVDKARFDEIVNALKDLRDARLARVKADDVTGIELRVGDERAQLVRDGSGWKGTGELVDVDAEAVRSLLEALEDTRAIDFIDAPQDDAEYGLDAPRAELRVTRSGAVEPLVIQLGGPTASGRNTYARVAGQSSVLVLSSTQAEKLSVHPLTLRSRVIFDLDPEQITALERTRKGRRTELTRGAAGWSLLEPPDTPPDEQRVSALVNDLARLRAKSVAGRDDFASWGLDQPVITLRFTSQPRPATQPATQPASGPVETAAEPAGPREHTLYVAQRNGSTYCRVEGWPYIFELDESVHRVFDAELILNRVFDFSAEEISGLRIEQGGSTLDLIREDGQWKYAPDPFVRLDPQRVQGLLNGIVDWKAEEYLAYRGADLSETWVQQAPTVVTIRHGQDAVATLHIDTVDADSGTHRVAWIELQRVFRLAFGPVRALNTDLDAYVQPEPAEKQ